MPILLGFGALKSANRTWLETRRADIETSVWAGAAAVALSPPRNDKHDNDDCRDDGASAVGAYGQGKEVDE
jgi:hypothetical protein